MIEAERFNHDLTLQFGLLSYECRDETDFIKKSIELVNAMVKCDAEDLDEIFFGDPPDKKEFCKALNKILDNISKLNYGN